MYLQDRTENTPKDVFTPMEVYRQAIGGKIAQVAGRCVFYNNSRFDGNNPAANAGDNLAVAMDKTALLPGQKATFANYTSYSRGVNGVMVDVVYLQGTPTAADFAFKVGNSNNPAGWAVAPAPTSVTVRKGAGIGGSDRVTIIWPDNAIAKQWLQVTVLPTANTGLAAADVFYFGNAVAIQATQQLTRRWIPPTSFTPGWTSTRRC